MGPPSNVASEDIPKSVMEVKTPMRYDAYSRIDGSRINGCHHAVLTAIISGLLSVFVFCGKLPRSINWLLMPLALKKASSLQKVYI
jgi:hypothetical protein